MTYQLTFTGDEVQSRLAQGFEETPSGIWRHREHGGVWWRDGLNQLVRVVPTLVAAVSAQSGGQVMTPSADWTATRIDARLFCPASGRRAFVGGIGAAANDYSVSWSNQPTRTFLGTDVLMVTVWLPRELPFDAKVSLVVSPDATITTSTANYREFIWTGYELMPGWNTLTLRWVEDQLADGQIGTTGTREYEPGGANRWTDFGTATSASSIGSYKVSIRDGKANDEVRVGAILTAPDQWAVSALSFGFDDCYPSVASFSIPVMEVRGWHLHMPVIASWALDGVGPASMPLSQIVAAGREGHTLIGHTWYHNGVLDTSLTQAQMLDDYTRMRDFWRARGVTTAATTFVWPRGEVTDLSANTLRGLGYVWAGGTRGTQNPLTAGAGDRMTGPRTSFELGLSTRWELYSRFNGRILRGESAIALGHKAIAGGASTETTLASPIEHYQAHYTALMDLVQAYEQSGRCVVVGDPMDTYRLAGHDPAGEWVA